MRQKISNAHFRAGFTLMEMVVVVVIIGIMTAMIVPEMHGTFEDALLRATGRELVNVCSLANSRAVSLNQACRVRLDAASGRYLLERKSRESGRESFVPLQDVAGAEGKLDSRITVEVRSPDEVLSAENQAEKRVENNSADTILFYADGTADAAQIRLRDRSGFQLVLQLNPVTARIQVVEPAFE